MATMRNVRTSWTSTKDAATAACRTLNRCPGAAGVPAVRKVARGNVHGQADEGGDGEADADRARRQTGAACEEQGAAGRPKPRTHRIGQRANEHRAQRPGH